MPAATDTWAPRVDLMQPGTPQLLTTSAKQLAAPTRPQYPVRFSDPDPDPAQPPTEQPARCKSAKNLHALRDLTSMSGTHHGAPRLRRERDTGFPRTLLEKPRNSSLAAFGESRK